ncbi:MAG: glycosyltransferase family 39 protein [Planctomycetes bacterium]|nr:glycosyltransferase family 39 protein [Planctomycetota bacterium]
MISGLAAMAAVGACVLRTCRLRFGGGFARDGVFGLLALLVGAGLCSIGHLGGLALGGLPWWLMPAGLVVAALVAAAMRAPDPAPRRAEPVHARHPVEGLGIAVGWLALLVLGVQACGWIATYADLLPHGDWDAWAIWNVKARFLHAGAEAWPRVASTEMVWSHPDYPLLVPGLSAFLAAAGDVEPAEAARTVGLVLPILLVLLPSLALGALRGPAAGAAAGLVVVATPAFLLFGPHQLADLPLAAFTCGAFVAVALAGQGSPGALPVAGLCTGFAAWTKNEGLLVALAVVGVWVVTRPPRRWIPTLRAWLPFVWGCLPGLGALLLFKSLLAPPNELRAATTLGGFAGRLFDPARHALSAQGLWTHFTDQVGLALPLLATATLLLRLRPRAESADALRLLAAVLTLHLAVYAIFVTTPAEPAWHVSTSMDRLLWQQWPALVVATLLLSRSETAPTGPAGTLG